MGVVPALQQHMKYGCSFRDKERSSWSELSGTNTLKDLGSIRLSVSGSWILLSAWGEGGEWKGREGRGGVKGENCVIVTIGAN